MRYYHGMNPPYYIIHKELSFCEEHPSYCANVGPLMAQKLDEYCAAFKEKKFDHAGTALHCAAFHGNEQAVAYLLQNCPELVEMACDRTALHCAALGGHERVVAQLLSARPALIDACTREKCTALHAAVQEGHEAVVAQLLAANPTSIDAVTRFGWTALHFAAYYDHARIASQLLAADPTLVNADGCCYPGMYRWTALTMAATEGYTDVVAVLMAANPDLASQKDSTRQTPFGYAIRKGHEGVVRVMLAANPELIHEITLPKVQNVLHIAMGSPLRSEFVVELWKLHPALATTFNNYWTTPLDIAIGNDHPLAGEVLATLTLDEAERATSNHSRLWAMLDKQCEALSLLLLPEVLGIVFEFLNFEPRRQTKRPKTAAETAE